jgi:hypothetical protein
VLINNAHSCCDVDFWTKHLGNTEANERAELKQIRGLRADTLHEALQEMQRQARINPRVINFMYHADFNPRRDEHLSQEERDRAFEIFEKERGIPPDAARIVMEHVKEGRQHWHVIWYRLDDNGRPFSDSLDATVAHPAAEKISYELGLEKVISPLTREPGTPRPPRAPKAWEMYRGDKSGLDTREVTAEVTGLLQLCENDGKAFSQALETRGYILARGDRIIAGEPALMVIDLAGNSHQLSRRIDGIKAAQVNELMRHIDRASLPTITEAKRQNEDRNLAALEADRATVRAEIEREEALTNAAIEKEKTEQRFLAKEDREKETRSGQQEKESLVRMYRGIGSNVWVAEHEDALFFSTDPARAAAFGKLHYVDVTAAEMAKFERPHSQRILEQEPLAQNDWRTADPSIIARLQPLESIHTKAGRHEKEKPTPEQKHEPPRPRFGDILITRAAETAMRDTRQHHGDHVTSPAAFRDALDTCRLDLASVTPAEAYKSQRERDFVKEIDRERYAPEYQAGEIVIVREQPKSASAGRVHKLDQTKAEDYLRCLGIDKGQLQGIEATKATLDDRAQLRQRAIEAAEQRKARGPQRGGLVAHQMWAIQRIRAAEQQRQREQERRERDYTEKQKRDSSELDPERYRMDPEYRRQVQNTQSWKSPEDKQRDRENDARTIMEQQGRER